MKDWKASTLGERVEFALKRSGLAHNVFARAAGLETATLSRVKADQSIGGKHERQGSTLEPIARVAKVSLRWLTSGDGDPDDAPALVTAPATRYPSKVPAAAAMRGIVSEEAIEAMLSEEHAGTTTDPGPGFWMDRAVWWDDERKKRAAREPHPIDEPPPMLPRPKKGKKR